MCREKSVSIAAYFSASANLLETRLIKFLGSQKDPKYTEHRYKHLAIILLAHLLSNILIPHK